MNLERQIIIDWLVGRPDDEAHPELVRKVMAERGATDYSASIHAETIRQQEIFYPMARAAIRRDTSAQERAAASAALRAYYESLDALSLVECFDGWCCHLYR
jgi:hypothetical protein